MAGRAGAHSVAGVLAVDRVYAAARAAAADEETAAAATTHVRHVLEKLRLRNRAEAAAFAARARGAP